MNWTPYIGIPYSQVDCWELVRKVYREVLYLDIPGRAETVAAVQDYWLSIAPGAERTYDVLVFDGEDKHVGMVIEHGRFLHNEHDGTNSCIENYLSCKWKQRIKKIYRYRPLASSVS